MRQLSILFVVLLANFGPPKAAPCELLSQYELPIEQYDEGSPVFLSLNDEIIAVETNKTVGAYDTEELKLLERRLMTLPRHVLSNRTIVRVVSGMRIRPLRYEDGQWVAHNFIPLQNKGEAFSLSADGNRLLVGLRLFLLNDTAHSELGTIASDEKITTTPAITALAPSGDMIAVLMSATTIGIFKYDHEGGISLQSTVETKHSVIHLYLSADASLLFVQRKVSVIVYEYDKSTNEWIDVHELSDILEFSLSHDARVISGRRTDGYVVFGKSGSSSWKTIWQVTSNSVDAVVVSEDGTSLAEADQGTVTVYQIPDCLWETSPPTTSPTPTKAPSRPPSRMESISASTVCDIVVQWQETEPIRWTREEIQRWESFTASWFERFFTSEFIDIHEYPVTNMQSRVTLISQTDHNVTYDQVISYDLWDANVTAEEIVLMPGETWRWRKRYYNNLVIAIPMPGLIHKAPILMNDSNTKCDPGSGRVADRKPSTPSPIGRVPIAASRSKDDPDPILLIYVAATIGGVVVICGALLGLCCCQKRGKQFPPDSCRVDGVVSIQTVSAVPVPVEMLGDPTVLPHVLPQFKDQVHSIPFADSTPAENETSQGVVG